jgi:ankyrin repeat protein
MPPSPEAPRRLPPNPSKEYLRKAAKRLARSEGLGLAAAQRRLALDHGYRTWAELTAAVEAARVRTPIYAATASGNLAEVTRLLADGAPVEGSDEDPGSPLWAVCAAAAPVEDRLAVIDALLAAGAFLHGERAGETPIHAAARTGPLAVVEHLLARGALEWQTDRRHRTPAAAALAGQAADRDAIAELLQRPVISDPRFRHAVAAIHAGDAASLAGLLDAHPDLLVERIVEPECYRQAERFQYFRDPKLFWFVADNPDLVVPMPPGMLDCAQVMIARGVDQADLDYTLELVMTSGPAQAAGLTTRLMTILLEAGARPSVRQVDMTLGHMLTEPIEALLANGHPMTARIAAGLGRPDDLARLLPSASPDERQAAFGLAVINRQLEAARLCLEAGADVDAFLPVHVHSTPLHQAAIHDDALMLELLAAHGARDDVADTMWRSTALDWARHQDRPAARAFLERLAAERRG